MQLWSAGITPRLLLMAVATASALICGGCSKQETILAGLNEKVAIRFAGALRSRGIDAAREADPTAKQKFVLVVDAKDKTRAEALLNWIGLENREERLARVDKACSGLTPTMECQQLRTALVQAIGVEEQIEQRPGILSAYVLIKLPAAVSLGTPPARASASAVIRADKGPFLRGTSEPAEKESIRLSIANAIQTGQNDQSPTPEDISLEIKYPEPGSVSQPSAVSAPTSLTEVLRRFPALPLTLGVSLLVNIILAAILIRTANR